MGRPAQRRLRRCAAAALAVVLVTSCGGRQPELGQVVQDALEAAPGPGSGAYAPPSPEQAREVALAVAALAAGADLDDAPDGYRRTDAATGGDGPVTVLEEQATAGLVPGRGTYAVRPGAGTALVLQVPHPRADRRTEELGTRLFELTGAGVLMVAGAHRTAGEGRADVARAPESVFSAVSGTVAGPGSVVVQLHGFAADDHPRGYGDVVLSSGQDDPSPAVRRTADALEDAGFRVCVYDGERCRRLAGTRNVQGDLARASGADFVHVEVSDQVRDDAARTEALLRALARAVTTTSAAGSAPPSGPTAGPSASG